MEEKLDYTTRIKDLEEFESWRRENGISVKQALDLVDRFRERLAEHQEENLRLKDLRRSTAVE